MYYDFTVKIPQKTGKISLHKIKDTTYVHYQYDSTYVKEKKYVIPQRTTIGKVSEKDSSLMFPNPNFYKYFPDEEFPSENESAERSSCIKVGVYSVLDKLIKETKLDEIAARLFDENEAGLFLDFAAYMIATEGNAAQYYPDYAYNHALFIPNQRIYSDSKISRFLKSISEDKAVKFLRLWNKEKDHDQKIYVSYDSTSKLCDAGDVTFVEKGHSKNGTEEPIVNVAVGYDAANREPLFYEEYPGSINDVSQLRYMLEKVSDFGYKDLGFILDRGYFSEENVKYMDAHEYEFIIMVKGAKALVNSFVKEVKGSFEEKRSYFNNRYRVHGITLQKKIFKSDEKNRYVHIFYDAKKAADEKENLENKIENMENCIKKLEGKKDIVFEEPYLKYFIPEYRTEITKTKDKDGNEIEKEEQVFVCARENVDVIDEEMSLCGYFCLISSEEMEAKDAIELYKSRDESEKLFAVSKTFLGGRRERVYEDASFGGKLLIEFAALILRCRMYTELKDAEAEMSERPNYMTVPAAIRELEKIEMVEYAAGVYRLGHAVTKTQKTILKAFGMTQQSVKSKASELSMRLNPKNITITIGGR